MARRNDHSRDELREMALSAAEQLLDQEGANALSTRKVATAIGYSVGALYLVFKNLDDLCWQINARTLDRLLAQLNQVTDSNAHNEISGYAHRYLDFSQQWPHRWTLLFEHSSGDKQAPPWLLAKIEQLFEQLENALQRIFSTSSQEQIQLAARTLWSGVHGVAVLVARDKLFSSAEGTAAAMVDGLISRYVAGWQLELDSKGLNCEGAEQ
ncbi:MAG: TetR/AcrR family transcriptional regulator [Amphritea sp.]